MIHMSSSLHTVDPNLPIIGPLLVECKVDRLVILITSPMEGDLVVLDVFEVLLRFPGCACTQPFIILAVPSFAVVVLALPGFVLWNREERNFLSFFALCFPDFHDRSHKFFQEPILHNETRPPMRHKIDQQSLDVGA